MFTLKTRLAESEAYAQILTRFLADILRVCIALKQRVIYCWKLIQ
jgi:hypothetical protein